MHSGCLPSQQHPITVIAAGGASTLAVASCSSATASCTPINHPDRYRPRLTPFLSPHTFHVHTDRNVPPLSNPRLPVCGIDPPAPSSPSNQRSSLRFLQRPRTMQRSTATTTGVWCSIGIMDGTSTLWTSKCVHCMHACMCAPPIELRVINLPLPAHPTTPFMHTHTRPKAGALAALVLLACIAATQAFVQGATGLRASGAAAAAAASRVRRGAVTMMVASSKVQWGKGGPGKRVDLCVCGGVCIVCRTRSSDPSCTYVKTAGRDGERPPGRHGQGGGGRRPPPVRF